MKDYIPFFKKKSVDSANVVVVWWWWWWWPNEWRKFPKNERKKENKKHSTKNFHLNFVAINCSSEKFKKNHHVRNDSVNDDDDDDDDDDVDCGHFEYRSSDGHQFLVDQ